MACSYGVLKKMVSMLMKYCIPVVSVLFAWVSMAADFSVRPEGDAVTVSGSAETTVTLRAGKLFYHDADGTLPTQEDYLLEVVNGSYPRIVDMLNGRISNIQLAVTNGNKGRELLVFYFAGGNQYGVRIYSVNGIEVKPLKSQPVSSNMRSVKVRGSSIVVQNEEIGADGKRFISTEVYSVAEGDCKLIREEKTAVAQ